MLVPFPNLYQAVIRSDKNYPQDVNFDFSRKPWEKAGLGLGVVVRLLRH